MSLSKSCYIPPENAIYHPIHRDEDLIPPTQGHGQVGATPEQESHPAFEALGLAFATCRATLDQGLCISNISHDPQVFEAKGLRGEVPLVESLG